MRFLFFLNRIKWLALSTVLAVVLGSCATKSPEIALQVSPYSMTLYAEDSIIEVGGETTTISAILFDQNDDPLGEGYGVRFSITMAPSMMGAERPSFEYQSTVDSAMFEIDIITDNTGTASIELYSGTAPGPIRIRAVALDNTGVFTEEHLVTVAIGGPASLALSADDPAIEVGNENTVVYATVMEEFGNDAGEGYGVRLEITEYPGTHGADPPSFEYPASEDSISHIYEGITDIDGRVEVVLFSGYVFGWVKIRAALIENENISVEEQLVTIEPGSPAFIDISFGAVGRSVGDSLYIPLGVGIWDQYSNPAGFGDTVYIDIEPDSIVTVENIIFPEFPEYPDSVEGWALTWLGYICNHSLEMIGIIASAGEVADTSSLFPLPVYNPEIYIMADPGAIWVAPPDTAGFSDITVRLLDGNGCGISNGIVYFTALVCGQISGQSIDTTDSNGYAYTEFMIHIDDIPGPPPDPPQCVCAVRASLYGYPDVVDEVEIICSRPR